MMRDYFEWLKCFMFLNRGRRTHQLFYHTGMDCCRKAILRKKKVMIAQRKGTKEKGYVSLRKSWSHSLTTQIMKISLEMLSVRPRVQNRGECCYHQFCLSTASISVWCGSSFSQPAPLPYGVSVSPDSEPCGQEGRGVWVATEAPCV